MLFSIPGGISSASFQMNEVIHNAFRVAGCFYVTVGIPVTITFTGATFWLVPYLMDGTETGPKHPAAWFCPDFHLVGLVLMSITQHIPGLFGVLWRTAYSTTCNDHPDILE